MSAFYPSTSATSQLSLLQDMAATDHCGTHAASVFSGGLLAPAVAHQNEPAVVERHAGSLSGSRTGFPPNFLSYAGADFRNFRPPTAVDASAAAKVSPTGAAAAIASRHRHSDESCKDDFGSGLDLTGMHEMRDVFKTAPLSVDHRPLGSPSSSSSSHRHPDQPSHLQQHHQMRCSELLQQQQQRHEEMFMQQARQWYLHQSPTTSATSVNHAGAADLVNGRSPGAAPPSLFRQEATGPLGDISPGGDPHCHWPPPPTYNGPITPVTQRQLSEQKELSPTQKAGDGVGGIPFYPWMAVVGWYIPPCSQPCFFDKSFAFVKTLSFSIL